MTQRRDAAIRALRAACPAAAVFVRRVRHAGENCMYRRRMSRSPESVFQHADEGPSFLARVAIAFALVAAGVGVAVLVAAG
jgi:hypothetical protein